MKSKLKKTFLWNSKPSQFFITILAKLRRMFRQYILRDDFLIELARWYTDRGDETLRLDYPSLNKDSIVFDIGGYVGDFAYDINKINPVVEKYLQLEESKDNIKKYTHNANKISYFQGDVFETEDLQKFKNLIKKVDFIFSDAHHSYEGLMSEYENLIKDILNEEFIVYYDDLSGDLLKAFIEISQKLSKSHKVFTFTFLINGWIGNHEKMHRNGIITNIDIIKNFKIALAKFL